MGSYRGDSALDRTDSKSLNLFQKRREVIEKGGGTSSRVHNSGGEKYTKDLERS